MSQWVQSKYSQDAKKWEVMAEFADTYKVDITHSYIHLPKDEYIKCDPPERWEICTRDSVEVESTVLAEKEALADVFEDVTRVYLHNGYRWAWSEKDPDALVIKRKVQ